jgi:hypothetical protein
VSGSAAITINATGATDKINIIGVVLDGTAVANTTGILFNSGGILTVQDSVIRNFSDDGIHFAPTGSSSISVSRTFVGNNGGYGILVQPQGSASATAVFERVQTQYNGASFYGIALDSTATTGAVIGTATDSVSSNNGGGYLAHGGGVSSTTGLTLVRSVAANNHTGVQGGPAGGGFVFISQTAITNNVIGCNGDIQTYGDNNVNSNGTDCIGATSFSKE